MVVRFLSINGSQIYGEPFGKLFGVLLDNRLSFNENVSTIFVEKLVSS